ncbi:MAG TPA: DUF692 domain-containing protein [Rhodocyclaceae bacterium]|nr:DUF692 domain-containing protein [Rhodocyclaceae bacterium]
MRPASSSVPEVDRACAGIGLRAPHYAEVLERLPGLGFLEVHSENFFHAGGAALGVLTRTREHYSLSLHGVGLSLASADVLAQGHLDKLAALVERVEPALVSEHLCWGAIDGVHFNDLLPFPYTRDALTLLVERVDQVQERLGRRILIENLSAYVQFRDSEMSECEFLAELARRSGCGLLLDVNNLYVNAQNFDFDARAELNALLADVPAETIGEVHLAGHSRNELCLIDTHGSRVCEDVWALYGDVIAQCGPVPTLIEWDTDIPALDVLLDEAAIAQRVLTQSEAVHV